ncbi:hypothetical protein CIK96_07895 [Prevotella sp. P4-98]|uniref:restriction endonuclease subunit S n=1 Tax=Prevotella sp. P4-98 TaxID=2024219 RepID=UPI000B9791CA|nr:restriction endonuclease subunit S [Prevotella sp. P4-98]OYP45842.1 hypothetical protein CIK96_07895 [Prevotella sp. P4-98]
MKLADIIETFISGDWGEEKVAEDTPNSVFCIRGADIVPITNHCFNGIPQRFVCDKTIENKTLKAGDLIIEKSGGSPTQSTGRIIYVSEDMIKAKGNVVCSNFCTAFRVKAGWNPLYVYYFWQNVYNHGAFFNFEGKTSGIKNLQLDNALSAIDIEYLPLEKQNRIVASLASIDEKIKVNRQINDNLEAMAKQLYDYWFVQFDFPNEEEKPYKSSGGAMVWNEKLKREIPKGLDAQKIGDIEKNIITGKTPSCADEDNFGGDIPFVTIDDIRGNLFVFGAQRTLSTKGADSQEKKYLPIGSLSVSCIGTIGVMGFVAKLAQTNQQINSIVFEHEYNKEFLYFALRVYFENAKAKTGNVFANMSKEEFASIIVTYPPKQILQAFHNKIAPIFDSIKNNIEEINVLTKQRDELLPLLMNGQTSVNYHLSAY